MVYILYNPYANNGSGEEGVEEVRAAFAAEEPVLRDLTRMDVKALLTSLTAEDKVILCGGDGTVNRLVNELDGAVPAAPLYMWRFGTGNDFLRDIEPDLGRKCVPVGDYLQNLPVVETEGKRIRFVNGCGGGVEALVCAKMNEARGRRPSYVKVAIQSFFKDFVPVSARVTVDGQTEEYDRVWMAGGMNGHFQGGGMLFAPGQDRSSDKLCLYLWHGTGRLSALLHFPSIMKGTYGKYTKHCVLRFGREIRVTFSVPQYLQFDGETLSGVSSFTIRK